MSLEVWEPSLVLDTTEYLAPRIQALNWAVFPWQGYGKERAESVETIKWLEMLKT